MLQVSIIFINALAVYLFWAHIYDNLKDHDIGDVTLCDFTMIFLVFLYDLGLLLDCLGVFNLL